MNKPRYKVCKKCQMVELKQQVNQRIGLCHSCAFDLARREKQKPKDSVPVYAFDGE